MAALSGLQGKRILITRARAQAPQLAGQLSALGALPIAFPTIEIAPMDDYGCLDQALSRLASYHWVVFTSVNGVAAFWRRLSVAGLDSAALDGRRLAAIGPATSRALEENGISAELVPDEYVAEAIAAGIGDVDGQWILMPRAAVAREALADELGRRGAVVHEIAAYRTLPARADPAALKELQRGVDVLTFTSASTVRNFVALLEQTGHASLVRRLAAHTVVACIGPITAQSARELGLPVTIQAETYTIPGLVEALMKYYASPIPRP